MLFTRRLQEITQGDLGLSFVENVSAFVVVSFVVNVVVDGNVVVDDNVVVGVVEVLLLLLL